MEAAAEEYIATPSGARGIDRGAVEQTNTSATDLDTSASAATTRAAQLRAAEQCNRGYFRRRIRRCRASARDGDLATTGAARRVEHRTVQCHVATGIQRDV